MFAYLYIAFAAISVTTSQQMQQKSVLEFFPAFHAVKAEADALQAEVIALKNELAILRRNFTDLKTEVTSVKGQNKNGMYRFKFNFIYIYYVFSTEYSPYVNLKGKIKS